MNIKIILLSLISPLIFGIIDGSFFLINEGKLQPKLSKLKFFDEKTAELLTGGISASLAIFIYGFINSKINQKFKLIENPFLDIAGILVATFFIIFIRKIILHYKK
jgi:hypothetical protein